MINFKIKIGRSLYASKAFIIFLLIPFIDTRFFQSVMAIDRLLSGWKYIAVIILILSLFRYADRALYLFVGTILMFFVCGGISTYLNDGIMLKWFKITLTFLAVCILTILAVRENSDNFITAVYYYLSCLVIVNFFVLVLGKRGIIFENIGNVERYNFFNSINQVPGILLPYFVIAVIYLHRAKKKGFAYFMLAVCLLSFLIQHSATGITGIAVLLILVLGDKIIKKIIGLNILTYYLTVLALFFGIIVFRLQNIFAFYIEKILKKNLTFTGRIYIWDIALGMIRKLGIWGKGYNMNEDYIYWDYVHLGTHNDYLQILIQSGKLSMMFFLIVLILVIRPVLKNKKLYEIRMISAGIFAFMLMMLFENYQGDLMLFMLLAMAYSANYFREKGKIKVDT